MDPFQRLAFKGLKFHIAKAIKESCNRTEVRVYNIANEVPNIVTFSLESGIEMEQDLAKIIDKTIKSSIDVGCDLSVIAKGILLGSFRSRPFVRHEAPTTIRMLMDEIFRHSLRYKGDTKQVVEGILAAVVIIANEYKLNAKEAVVVARQDMVSSAKEIDSKFADEIQGLLTNL